ncbi:hypothetical protein B0H67DRAFT_316268 [Lasiosphaeris hirsuta]|uniref:Uncharacterized protein n=1 Tax=Lasiosphaeris hirsuta TaxID=260670 RepID=A0AA40A1E6_9PEZI|nr:hypothetical protein B0H67DRAFT_316268 [Lasiosphaeris hirsuta]
MLGDREVLGLEVKPHLWREPHRASDRSTQAADCRVACLELSRAPSNPCLRSVGRIGSPQLSAHLDAAFENPRKKDKTSFDNQPYDRKTPRSLNCVEMRRGNAGCINSPTFQLSNLPVLAISAVSPRHQHHAACDHQLSCLGESVGKIALIISMVWRLSTSSWLLEIPSKRRRLGRYCTDSAVSHTAIAWFDHRGVSDLSAGPARCT